MAFHYVEETDSESTDDDVFAFLPPDTPPHPPEPAYLPRRRQNSSPYHPIMDDEDRASSIKCVSPFPLILV